MFPRKAGRLRAGTVDFYYELRRHAGSRHVSETSGPDMCRPGMTLRISKPKTKLVRFGPAN
jgi:hypothetical protein